MFRFFESRNIYFDRLTVAGTTTTAATTTTTTAAATATIWPHT